MAHTSYLSRVIYKPHTTDEGDYFIGKYKLLVNAKSIPSPVSTPNTVESTTLEDNAQTFEKGIKTSSSKDITGNLDKESLDSIDGLGEQQIDIFQLYGTDGLGSVAKYCYTAQATASPSDVSGADSILEMTVSVIPNTAAQRVTDKYTITYDESKKEFTVAAKS